MTALVAVTFLLPTVAPARKAQAPWAWWSRLFGWHCVHCDYRTRRWLRAVTHCCDHFWPLVLDHWRRNG